MTGRELIMFILENHLEDVLIFDGENMRGFVTLDEAAVMMNYGIYAVKALYEIGKIPGFVMNGTIYIYKSKEFMSYVGKTSGIGEKKL